MRPLTVTDRHRARLRRGHHFRAGARRWWCSWSWPDEHPQFRTELPLLAVYLAVFLGLTALAGISFIGLARQRPWRRWAQAALWAALAGWPPCTGGPAADQAAAYAPQSWSTRSQECGFEYPASLE